MTRLAISALMLATGLAVTGCKDATITPEARIEARRIWTERCANCHGPRGRGDGPGAASLDPRPRDFGDSAWQGQASDERIARVILDGGRAVGLSAQMAANPDLEGKPAVVAALVEHVRSLGSG